MFWFVFIYQVKILGRKGVFREDNVDHVEDSHSYRVLNRLENMDLHIWHRTFGNFPEGPNGRNVLPF